MARPKFPFLRQKQTPALGNAPDDKKKGRVKKLTTYEQKILLLCLHLL